MTDNAKQGLARLCDEVNSLIPAYSLGATTPEETRLIEQMLPHCAEAASNLAEYRLLVHQLLHIIPNTEAPPPVDALMARIAQAERKLTPQQSLTPVQDRPHHRLQHTSPMPVPLSAGQEAHRDNRGVSRRHERGWWLLAAASTVLAIILVASNLYWAAQVNSLRADQQRTLDTLAQVVATQQAAVRLQPLVLTGQSQHRTLTSTSEAAGTGAHGVFTWDSAQNLGAVVVQGLPVLDAEQTYQLWLVQGEESLSLGLFSVDAEGAGTLIFHSPQPIEQYQHIGISIERATGSTAPTTPHLLLGEI